MSGEQNDWQNLNAFVPHWLACDMAPFPPHNSRSGFYKNVSKLLTLPGLCLPALSGLLCGCPHHGFYLWKSRHCQLFFSFYHFFQSDPSSGRRASAALKVCSCSAASGVQLCVTWTITSVNCHHLCEGHPSSFLGVSSCLVRSRSVMFYKTPQTVVRRSWSAESELVLCLGREGFTSRESG